MELLENMPPGQIVAVVVGLLLGAAAAINQLGSAVEKIAKAVKTAKAPNEEQDKRLDELEKWRKHIDAALIRDLKRFESLDNGERVTQRALLALLDHGIDGNNVEQMQRAKEDLQNHLINR